MRTDAKPIVLVRNDVVDTLGVAPRALAEAGAETRLWEALNGHPAPDLDGVGGLVVFGSTYNVEHADEQPFIQQVGAVSRAAIDRGIPFLGVCFGAQLLAWTMGAEVKKAPVREVGFEPLRPLHAASVDPILSHYEMGDPVFQWHMDTFDLPDDAELLASGDFITNQAFRVGDHAWGVQFHFEVDAAEIALWLDAFSREGDLLEEWGKTRTQVEQEATAYADAHERKGTEVFRRFAAFAQDTRP
ncbi:MAG: type 1 glutamine amidotransferase [Actinomycetota bacterium]